MSAIWDPSVEWVVLELEKRGLSSLIDKGLVERSDDIFSTHSSKGHKLAVDKVDEIELLRCWDGLKGVRMNLEEVDSVLRSGDNKEFEKMFMPRTQMDIAIRLIRYTDIQSLYLLASGRKRRVMLSTVAWEGVDYITCMLVFLHIWMLTEDMIFIYEKCDVLAEGPWEFSKRAKVMTGLLKNSNDLVKYSCLVEMSSLTGYRNMPVEGFDLREEAISLAKGGKVPHNFPIPFAEAVVRFLSTGHRIVVKPLSFFEYIKSNKWATAGSSDVGYIYLLDKDKKEKKVKCKKNFLLDVETAESLYQMCIKSNQQVNYTIVKCELGKVRLAVASDIQTYLISSWMVYLSGECYLDWPGVTLQQSSFERLKSIDSVRNRLKGRYSVPFDYASFDHHCTTEEIKAIVTRICDSASVLGCAYPEFDQLYNSCINSFDNSILITRNPSEGWVMTDKVTGGLMSGHRMTSIIGNGYNSVVTSMVINTAIKLGYNEENFSFRVQGDDSSIICKTALQAQLIIALYDMFGIVFKPGAFSILSGQTEYLRQWYGPDSINAYLCRSIPSIVQRKPWSGSVWNPVELMRGHHDKCGVLRRRGATGIDELYSALKSRWSQLYNVPFKVISIPLSLGGLGIGVWDSRSRVTPAVPSFDRVLPVLTEITNERENRLKKKMITYNLPAIDMKRYCKDLVAKIITQDDIRVASAHAKNVWIDQVKQTHFLISYDKPIVYQINYATPIRMNTLDESLESRWLIEDTSLYGRYEHEVSEYRLLSSLKRYSSTNYHVRDVMQPLYPSFCSHLFSLTRKGHVSEVLDYLGGSINLSDNFINPDFSATLTLYVSSYPKTFRSSASLAFYHEHLTFFRTMLAKSDFYQYVFAHN